MTGGWFPYHKIVSSIYHEETHSGRMAKLYNFWFLLDKKVDQGGGRFQIFLEFSPWKLGKMNPIWLLHIFQMGWNSTTNQLNLFCFMLPNGFFLSPKKTKLRSSQVCVGASPVTGRVLVPNKKTKVTQDGHVFFSKMPSRNRLASRFALEMLQLQLNLPNVNIANFEGRESLSPVENM